MTITITEAKATLSPKAFAEWKAEQKRAIMERSQAKWANGSNTSLEQTGFFEENATHDEDGRPLILTESDLVRVITTGKL